MKAGFFFRTSSALTNSDFRCECDTSFAPLCSFEALACGFLWGNTESYEVRRKFNAGANEVSRGYFVAMEAEGKGQRSEVGRVDLRSEI